MTRLVVLGRMWVRSLDLDKAFRADRLVATSRFVEERRIVHEADGAFGGVFVEIGFDRLAVDMGVFGQADFLWRQVRRGALRSGRQ